MTRTACKSTAFSITLTGGVGEPFAMYEYRRNNTECKRYAVSSSSSILASLLAYQPKQRIPTKNCLLDHVQSFCYDTACFSSEVVQTGIPELDIGLMREPALIDE